MAIEAIFKSIVPMRIFCDFSFWKIAAAFLSKSKTAVFRLAFKKLVKQLVGENLLLRCFAF